MCSYRRLPNVEILLKIPRRLYLRTLLSCFRAIVLFPSRALSTEGRSQFGLASEEAVAKSKPSSIPHFAI